jgi:hypothetical protein
VRTTRDYDIAPRYEPSGAGWIVFATVMLGLAGLWNFIDGIAAISSAHVYVADANYVFGDLNTWGWIVMFLGVLQVLAALALMSGSKWARWFGIAVAGLNAVGQLCFVPAYPWWALAMFAVDVLIIYGLAVYGGSRLRAY